MTTFYWHDYETWGATPSVDRPCQFAGVRTDMDLNMIGDPLVMYCRPPVDIWPHPEACLVTGITPQKAWQEGVTERDFIHRIHAEMSTPNTCTAGYNNLRFDDEVTRYTLYRNYFDPYEREWRNGNSRWDIIDMVRLTYAVRPDGMEWPLVDGVPSFKLENMTAANNIDHGAAHDAFSDVAATIALARLLKQRKTALYDYVFNHRSKHSLFPLIDFTERKPLLHISSKYPARRGCAALVAPLAPHPINKNAILVFDLAADPSPLADLSAEAIAERIFTAQDDLDDGVSRLPVKAVHLNKCPILATAKLFTDDIGVRLGIDKSECEVHWQALRRMDIGKKIQAVFAENTFTPSTDPERQLYDGFIGDEDKKHLQRLRTADAATLKSTTFVFNDARLNNMLLRYKARNFPDSLTPEEVQEWHEHVKTRLQEGDDGMLSLAQIRERLACLQRERSTEPDALTCLNDVAGYVEQQSRQWQLDKG